MTNEAWSGFQMLRGAALRFAAQVWDYPGWSWEVRMYSTCFALKVLATDGPRVAWSYFCLANRVQSLVLRLRRSGVVNRDAMIALLRDRV